MKKIFFIALFLMQLVTSTPAETVGSLGYSTIYRSVSDVKELDGQLQLIVYGNSPQNGSVVISAPTFDVHINDIKVATVKQNFSDLAFQQGTFKFLKINLPTGKYNLKLIQNTVFNSGEIMQFDFIIQKGLGLPVVIENRRITNHDRIPTVIGNSLKVIADAEINQANYLQLRESMLNTAEVFDQSIQKNTEIALQLKRVAEEEAAKKSAEKAILREAQIKLAELEIQKNKQLAEAASQQQARAKEDELKKQKESTDKEHDATCKSFGAKFGTDPYIACRIALSKSLQEQVEREKLRAIAESSRQQELKQQFQRDLESQRSEDKRAFENSISNKRLAEEQQKRDRIERLEYAQKAFEAAARLSQPTPGAPSPIFPQMQTPQRTICFRNGNSLDCRTQ
jgi:hypothetical protein